MQNRCEAIMISKKGTSDDLRESLTRNKLQRMTTEEFKKFPLKVKGVKVDLPGSGSGAAKGVEVDLPGSSSGAAKGIEVDLPGSSSGAAPPSEAHQEEPPQQHEAPADAEGKDGKGDAGGPGSSEVTLFGRSTFTMDFNKNEDQSSFFCSVDKAVAGPDVDKSEGHLALAEAGEHGVIPVAAMVKIFQGFSDSQQGGHHIAVLLTGRVEVEPMFHDAQPVG